MKLFPYPQPQPHLKPPASLLPSEPLTKRYWDHYQHVSSWLDKNGLRRITEVVKQGGQFPSIEEVRDWLDDHCRTKARRHFDLDKLERMLDHAAEFAVIHWDADEYAKRVRRAVNGGKKSRRTATFTTDQLRALEGLSIPKQAEALGCSESTVSTLRRQVAVEDAAAATAEIDALFADMLPALEEHSPSSDPEPELPAQGSAEHPANPDPQTPIQVPDYLPAAWAEIIAKDRAERLASVSWDDIIEAA